MLVLGRVRQIPLPLALIVGVGLVLTLTWAVVTPPFQGPDEPDHFAYVQKIAENGEIPWRPGENCGDCPSGVSSEVVSALTIGWQGVLQLNARAKDNTTAYDEERWREVAEDLPEETREDTLYRDAMRNGPAYYLYGAVAYLAASSGDVFTRAFAVRLVGLPLVALVIVCAWVLTGLLVGRRPWLQALAAAIVAVNAQFVSLSGFVNPDVMLTAAYSVALVLMALLLLRGPTRATVAGLVAMCALAPLSHPRGLAILAPVAFTAVIVLWRRTAPHGPRVRAAAAAAAAVLGAVGAYVLAHAATRGEVTVAGVREFGSYLWQFYLPRLGFMGEVPRADWSAHDVYIERFWGMFGGNDIVVAPWVMDAMATAARLGLLALLVVLVVRRRAVARVWPVLAALALALVSYVFAMHIGAWRNLDAGATDPVLTGRYLLPFVILLGAAVAVGLSWLPRRIGPAAGAVFVSAAFALQLAALGALVTRFHV